MKPRDYCCCAIPLINVGIYATLTEQLVLGIVVGTLSIATPKIVGAATPAIAPWVMAVISYIGAGVQVLGFIGVLKEKTILYRRYVTLHLLTLTAGFSVAAVWIIVSATRHSVAKTNCENTFFSNPAPQEGQVLCNVFPWVDIGLMGGLWVFFSIAQLYFYIVIQSYGTSQRQAHDDYADIPLKGFDSAANSQNRLHVRGDSEGNEPANSFGDYPAPETQLSQRNRGDYIHARDDSGPWYPANRA